MRSRPRPCVDGALIDLENVHGISQVARRRSVPHHRAQRGASHPAGDAARTGLCHPFAAARAAGHLLYDIGRSHAETNAVLETANIHFNSVLNGVTVRFIVPTAVETVFEGGPAFRSPLPVALQYLQRREHFRTKVIRPAMCTAKLPDGTPLSLKIDDLSIGGARLQSSTISPQILPTGSLLKDVVLDFNDLGKVEVNLSIASHQTIEHEGLATYFYGCHMEQLTRAKETQVQKLVFALELLNRPNTRSAAPALAR
jgi:c-di-GMP-binding flagellar brake protein YcgR